MSTFAAVPCLPSMQMHHQTKPPKNAPCHVSNSARARALRFRPLSQTKKRQRDTHQDANYDAARSTESSLIHKTSPNRGRALLVFRGDCAPRESCPRRAIGRRARPGGWLPRCDCVGRYDVSGEQAAGAVMDSRGVHEAIEKTGWRRKKKGGVLTRDTGAQRYTTHSARKAKKKKKRGFPLSPPHLTRDETRRRT